MGVFAPRKNSGRRYRYKPTRRSAHLIQGRQRLPNVAVMSRATARNNARPPASGPRRVVPRITGEFVRPNAGRGSAELTLGGLGEAGVTLARLYESQLFERLRPAVRLRFVHDALESLAMLQLNPRLQAAHPDLVITPQSVVLGLDGAARVNLRLARQTTAAGEGAPDVDLKSSQELRQGASRAGVRPDVYSFGVLAWEALRGEALLPGNRHDAAALAQDMASFNLEEAWMTHFLEAARASLGLVRHDAELLPRALMTMLAPAAEALTPRQQIADSIQGIQSVSELCELRPKPPAPTHACADEPSRRLAVQPAQACEVREEETCSPSTQRRPVLPRVELAVLPPVLASPPKQQQTAAPQVGSSSSRTSPRAAINGAHCALLLVLLSVLGVAAGLLVQLVVGLR